MCARVERFCRETISEGLLGLWNDSCCLVRKGEVNMVVDDPIGTQDKANTNIIACQNCLCMYNIYMYIYMSKVYLNPKCVP